ncbi:glycine zipper 2TM domain-containing protein [Candidimonas humi]|uniref:Glycine zipper 2TM domain-containing protein n=1 Tax=Candidimonas humi TaxID=683355 RepID=A0ABV8P0A7_9BURK|nr:glycine zipper 2TM domain-containing protein [Candidimonas humi]MBV6305372.1 glycine zipper 2TM domain-containing protein [Candidimonas humi]
MNLQYPSLAIRAPRLLALAATLAAASMLAGCVNDTASGSVYTYDQAQREQVVRTGTVQSVRPVLIEQRGTSGVGALAGGVLGGAVGSTIGRGGGNVLATVGGAIAGGLLGNAVENQAGRTQGLEITIRLDNGETRVIAQAADVPISPGQRVRLISGGGPTRVVPM